MLVLLVMVALFAALADGAGTAGEPGFEPVAGESTVAPPATRALVFPVRGEHNLTASFGDPRPGGRRHEGVDILARKRTPVVAVAGGRIRWIHDGRAGRPCCAVSVEHDDGWRSRYLHLNNDTSGTDDGAARGIAPHLRAGSRVQAGELLGWVGDSGNAEGTVPHLHFELRSPTGVAVDPYAVLQRASEAMSAG